MSKNISKSAKKLFLEAFGQHICRLREEKHLTKVEFAHICNSYTKKVSRMECGEYDFKISSLLVLAKGLGISPAEILDFEIPQSIVEGFVVHEDGIEKH